MVKYINIHTGVLHLTQNSKFYNEYLFKSHIITKIMHKVDFMMDTIKNIWIIGLLMVGISHETLANGDDFLRSTGKIYSVVAVILILFLFIVFYLVYLDRKISQIERQKQD